MALAIKVTKRWFEGKKLKIVATVTASGSYTTGGDTLNFTTVTGFNIQSSQLPFDCIITGQAGFPYSYVAGTTQANCLMKVFVATTTGANLPLAEHSAATYVAGVTGDTITLRAEFEIR